MQQLKKERWVDLFFIDAEKSDSVDTIYSEKELQSKVRQVLPDE